MTLFDKTSRSFGKFCDRLASLDNQKVAALTTVGALAGVVTVMYGCGMEAGHHADLLRQGGQIAVDAYHQGFVTSDNVIDWMRNGLTGKSGVFSGKTQASGVVAVAGSIVAGASAMLAKGFGALRAKLAADANDYSREEKKSMSVWKNDERFLYGKVVADKEMEGLLRGCGAQLGRYDERTGSFYVCLDKEARTQVEQFGADFKLNVVEHVSLSEFEPSGMSNRALQGEKAFLEFQANGGAAAAHAVDASQRLAAIDREMRQRNSMEETIRASVRPAAHNSLSASVAPSLG